MKPIYTAEEVFARCPKLTEKELEHINDPADPERGFWPPGRRLGDRPGPSHLGPRTAKRYDHL